jgi:hypothetical protein
MLVKSIISHAPLDYDNTCPIKNFLGNFFAFDKNILAIFYAGRVYGAGVNGSDGVRFSSSLTAIRDS